MYRLEQLVHDGEVTLRSESLEYRPGSGALGAGALGAPQREQSTPKLRPGAGSVVHRRGLLEAIDRVLTGPARLLVVAARRHEFCSISASSPATIGR
jgi:hypothetical protein